MTVPTWSIAWLADQHPSVALDANVLIYLLEGIEDAGRKAAVLVDAIEAGRISGSMATIGEAEVLAGPAGRGDAEAFERMATELRELGLRLVPLSPEIAADAAWIRGQAGMTLPDAIHVAAARSVGATALVTNDRQIRSRPQLVVLSLDDLDIGSEA